MKIIKTSDRNFKNKFNSLLNSKRRQSGDNLKTVKKTLVMILIKKC